MKRAKVYFEDQLAGWLSKNEEDYSFFYETSYLKNPASLPISLSLPLQKEEFHSPRLFPFFKHLIPEGWLFDLNARLLKIDPRDEFGMLLATGKDCVGAVSVVSEEHE